MGKRRSEPQPKKYKSILEELEVERIYHPVSIVRLAVERGLLKTEPGQERTEKHRLRIGLGQLVHRHGFPVEGDGPVSSDDQVIPLVGWYGWRWQGTLDRDEELR